MIKKIKERLFKQNDYQISYSQQGEDIIINFILNQLNIENPFYIDLGSNDPIKFSNTYFFYKKGNQGICVDPNIDYIDNYKSKRSRDLFLSMGITGGESTSIPYYRMSWPEFNTFDEEQAKEVEKYYKGRNDIVSVVERKIQNVREFLEEHVSKELDFLSLDVEGLDLEILTNWDFDNHAPKIICVETKDLKEGKENDAIFKLLDERKYSLVAKNLINGIFVRK